MRQLSSFHQILLQLAPVASPAQGFGQVYLEAVQKKSVCTPHSSFAAIPVEALQNVSTATCGDNKTQDLNRYCQLCADGHMHV